MAPAGIIDRIKSAITDRQFIKGLIKDIAFAIAVVALFAALLYMYAGVWPPMVSVDGRSMLPNMRQGDLIVLQGLDRTGVTTHNDAVKTGYKRFNDYGDVIIYNPDGNRSITPVIHRAMYWVEEGDLMWPGGPPAPHSGYITQGDNNFLYDQSSSISLNQPVKPEWIVGISQVRVPYLGGIRALIPS